MLNRTFILQLVWGSAIVSGLLFFSWKELHASATEWMPVRYVRVEGAFQHLSKDKIKAVVNEQVRHGYFEVDLQHLRHAISTLPWAEQVTVERVWPDAIKVRIYEQKPVARWNNVALMNAQGELFQPENLTEFDYLPLIDGPDGQEKKLLEISKGLVSSLKDQALELAEFSVNDRRAWQLRLRNGLEIKLGRSDQLKNVQRFLVAMKLLGDDILTKATAVDLRYPNGFVLSWKAEQNNIDWRQFLASRT